MIKGMEAIKAVVRRNIALLFVLAVALPALRGQEVQMRRLPENQKISYEWTREAWSRDSKPYRELRERLELLTLKDARSQLADAARVAKAKPKDAFAQFHWALLALRAQDFVVDMQAIIKALAAPRLAMAAVDSPRCSEYARLRFLYEAWLWCQDPHALALVAERLYEKGYRDYPFRFWRHSLLATDAKKDLHRLSQVISEVRRFADEFPHEPRARMMVGTVYSYKFPLTRDAEDAYAAIREEKRALAMLGPKDPLRDNLQFVIDAELRRLKDWGFPPPPKGR